ncbi:ABC transporter permease [Selenomonas sp. oral taxon 149]|uniref:ABC transporter permease n=1 Tax=Selenomonas sp. oral taxon 149 TaxID=712535 RepID=UPI0001E0AF60|nr:ABC transporter permease [Selenomonas sp. oral taxon 149]EFM23280.1 ABC transporter, permease protein [Selenomonas sp. oral taxon 149 str. 67H29BP]
MTLSALVRRCAQFIPVFFGITVLSFTLIHLAPSDPVSVRLSLGGIAVDPAAAAQMRTEMGLDRPLSVQYGDWLMRFLHGDMGTSYRSDRPVSALLLQALPYTLTIAGSAMLLTLLISLPLGIAVAAYRNSALDCTVRFLTFIGNAVPSFIVGILLMFLFSYQLGWIPVLAGNSPIGMVLPTAALALIMSARYIRQIRAVALDELAKDYIIGLRARGIPERRILFGNVLKNIMGVVITLTAISVGSLLGGVVIIETLFNRPGVGSLLMAAISSRDYPVIQAAVVWMALAYFVVNLLTDLSYRRFNPRIRGC